MTAGAGAVAEDGTLTGAALGASGDGTLNRGWPPAAGGCGLALLSGGEHLRPERIGRRRCIEDGLGNVLRDGLLEQPILHVR